MDLFKLFGGLFIFTTLVGVAFLGTVGYVVVHFLSKVW